MLNKLLLTAIAAGLAVTLSLQTAPAEASNDTSLPTALAR